MAPRHLNSSHRIVASRKSRKLAYVIEYKPVAQGVMAYCPTEAVFPRFPRLRMGNKNQCLSSLLSGKRAMDTGIHSTETIAEFWNSESSFCTIGGVMPPSKKLVRHPGDKEHFNYGFGHKGSNPLRSVHPQLFAFSKMPKHQCPPMSTLRCRACPISSGTRATLYWHM